MSEGSANGIAAPQLMRGSGIARASVRLKRASSNSLPLYVRPDTQIVDSMEDLDSETKHAAASCGTQNKNDGCKIPDTMCDDMNGTSVSDDGRERKQAGIRMRHYATSTVKLYTKRVRDKR